MESNTFQGTVAKYAARGGVLNSSFTTNFLENLTAKEFWKSVKNWQKYGHEFRVLFLAHPVVVKVTTLARVCQQNNNSYWQHPVEAIELGLYLFSSIWIYVFIYVCCYILLLLLLTVIKRYV